MTLTQEALHRAITGEFHASRNYAEYAKAATREGYPNIAYLFKALAQAEEIHLKNHRQALSEPYTPPLGNLKGGSTLENLRNSLATELDEHERLYPGWLKDFKKEFKTEMGKLAKISMEWAGGVEKIHASVIQVALQNLEAGKDADFQNLWVCKVCGSLAMVQPTEVCPVCKHDPRLFTLVVREV